MSTPSSSTDEQAPRRRDLRDSTLGRIAIIVAVLAIAGVSARSCSSRGGGGELTREEAVAAAETVAVFEGDEVLVRYLNQGIPPRGTWIVSFYNGPRRHPTASQTILVDAETGQIVDDGR